ncbi:MAG TPA: hypothetical protein VLC74_02380 [Rhizomicrobium sp.]|nr:hypothetical protein [Rhizomicrobium sp.]
MKSITFGGVPRWAALGITLLFAAGAHAAINISTQATQNMSCSGGICTATAQKAYLNVNDVTNFLAAGDLKIVSGAGAEDIHIQAPFSWTSTSRLTLDAQRSIEFEKPVTVAGTGAMTLITKDGAPNGTLSFRKSGRVKFWDLASNLRINGRDYTLINTVQALSSKIAADPTGSYALADNHDAAADGPYSGPPMAVPFTGRFEGLGNSVSNLTISSHKKNAQLGFFLRLGKNGSITNFELLNISVSGGGNTYGGLVAYNDGKISRVLVSGYIPAGHLGFYCGGVAAFSDGIITDAISDVSVYVPDTGAEHNAGSLVGINGGLIVNSVGTGSVSGGCCAENEVQNNLGGLVGMNGGTILASFATGGVYPSSHDVAGGLIGINSGSVANAYESGEVQGGPDWIGGLIGYTEGGSLQNGYAVGRLDDVFEGGVLGVDGGEANTNAYWDLDTTGVNNPSQGAYSPANDPGLIGLTDTQLKSALPDGFDPQVWGQSPNINNGYPYLLANPPPKGNRPIRHYRSGAHHAR